MHGEINVNSSTYTAYVKNTYSTMNIKASSDVGGLVGRANSYSSISSSYAIGKVEASSYPGGLVARSESTASASNSYWIKETTGQSESKLGVQKAISALSKMASYSSWDFTSTWEIDEGKSLAYLQGMEIPSIVYELVKDYPVMEGQGTSSNPYIITTPEQLAKITADMTAYYKLGNDIDLGNIANWVPIGTEDDPFTGSLDGNGYTISNMKINSTAGYLGLFGYTEGSTIKNLNLNNYEITGYGKYIGGLVGYNQGDIIQVSAVGKITMTGTSSYVGGLVGIHYEKSKNSSKVINRCYTGGTITYSGTTKRGQYVGGIARRNKWK